MTSKLTSEQLIKKAQEQIAFCRDTKITGEGRAHVDQCAALFEIALAALGSEPVGEFYEDGPLNWYQISDGDRVPAHRRIPLYRHAQPATERDQVRREHAEWSQSTFGDVGPVGPLKHLSKEALEAADEPRDLSEWADMQFLLWDAQRRAGITDEQITQAMIEKLAVNKTRLWPKPKDGEPRMHIKEQPAPVVDADDNFYSWFGREWHEHYQQNQYTTAAKQMLGVMAESAWKAGRDAMLNHSGDANKMVNSPVIPDGWVMVPREMTDEIGEAIAREARCCGGIALDIYDAALAAAPQEVS